MSSMIVESAQVPEPRLRLFSCSFYNTLRPHAASVYLCAHAVAHERT